MKKKEKIALLIQAINLLLKNPNLYSCDHIYTHRGGAIWTICDDCGESFADDMGGVPMPKEHSSITNALNVLELIKVPD